MNEFDYHAPTSVEQAVELLSLDGTRPLAGGTDLIVQMRERRRVVKRIVDLKHLPTLTTVTAANDGWVEFGAALNATALSFHTQLSPYSSIVEASRMIGSHQIQNRASIGGNVCNASPSADAIPPLIALGADAVIVSAAGMRVEPVEALFLGPGKITLRRQELLVSFRLPPPDPDSASTYLRFTPRREMDIAVAGVGAMLQLASDGKIKNARLALSAVGPTPLRAPIAEARLRGEVPSTDLWAEAARLAAREAQPISDTRATAEYRRELVKTLTARALASCCTRSLARQEHA